MQKIIYLAASLLGLLFLGFLLVVPWTLYNWLVHSFMNGKISAWIALPAAVGDVCLAGLFSFGIGSCLRVAVPSGVSVYVGFLAGAVMLAAAVYPWFLGGYVWQTVLVRIVWSWLFGVGGVFCALMLAMIGDNKCH